MASNRILFRTPVNGYTGYGLHAFQIVNGLLQMGYEVHIRYTSLDIQFGSIPQYVASRMVEQDQHDEWELLLHSPGYPCAPGRKTIYFTMWESTELPKGVAKILNQAECIVVPSHWNSACFLTSGVQRPIRVVPLGINVKAFHYSDMDMTGPCVFGTGGRLNSGGQRKAIGDVIEAFLKAFPRERDVRLNVKLFPDCNLGNLDDSRIDITRAFLSEEQLKSWFTGITCFVSASRGEGWGLMQQQALAVGRPLASVIYGGVAEFFSAKMGYPLQFNLVPAQGFYANCGCWAEVDKEHLISIMRDVYVDRVKARNLGCNGALAVSKLTWDHSVARLVQLLQDFNVVN